MKILQKEFIVFTRLEEVPTAHLVELMNIPSVQKYLPLLEGPFTEADCTALLQAKKEMWQAHGFGPYAFMINNTFAGWGGLQPEEGEADFALILHPNFWGYGLKIFNRIKKEAFEEKKLPYITALLPPERHNLKAITRLGFKAAGQTKIATQTFLKFKLMR